jgi:regulator of RNase E activity RraA
MRTDKDRVQVEALGGTVNIGDARCGAGDILRGDADGVIVIPRAHENAVLDAAEEIDKIEDEIRRAVQDGISLRDARARHGYHSLQTRKK